MDPRKIAAATVGVVEYMKAEQAQEESRKISLSGRSSVTECGQIRIQGSPWAAAGRADSMQLRSLVQLRAFRG